MICCRNISEYTSDKRSIVTIGSFDGVHCGHRILLDKVVSQARSTGAQSVVVTFGNHPRAEQELTVEQEKIALLEGIGIDVVVILSFEEVCHVEAEVFVREVLVGALRAQNVIVGFDHRFGRERKGDVALLRQLGEEYDFDVTEVAEQFADGREVSSTVIRNAIKAGDMTSAKQLLGYSFMVSGKYNGGQIEVGASKILPQQGEYNIEADYGGKSYSGRAIVKESAVYITTNAPIVTNDIITLRFNG